MMCQRLFGFSCVVAVALVCQNAQATSTTSYFSGGQCTGYPFPAYVTRASSSGEVYADTVTDYPEVLGDRLMCAIERSSDAVMGSTPATPKDLMSATITVSEYGSSCELWVENLTTAGDGIGEVHPVYDNGTPNTASGYTKYTFELTSYQDFPFAYFICDTHVLGYSITED